MNDRIVLLNFSGVYSRMRFWKEYKEAIYLDFSSLKGTNCYCDDEAAKKIRQQLTQYGPEGIHFLDSGNYHYITRLWTDLIREPFDLLVLDHHTDMQQPAFGGILSCGGWLRTVLEANPCLRKVYLAGPSQEAAREDGVHEFGDRVFFADEEQMRSVSWREIFADSGSGLEAHPLYISLDKDILCPEEAAVNWDQGEARLEEVLRVLKAAFDLRPVMGVDLCGENPEEMEEDGSFHKAEKLNRALLENIGLLFKNQLRSDETKEE